MIAYNNAMGRYSSSTTPDGKTEHGMHLRKRLEKLSELYVKLEEKLDELEEKIEKSPTLLQQPNKPR